MDGDELNNSTNLDYPCLPGVVVHTIVQALRSLRQEDYYELDSVSKAKKTTKHPPKQLKITLIFLFIKENRLKKRKQLKCCTYPIV